MRVNRVFLDATLRTGDKVELDAATHHHIVQVLRLKTGAPVIVFNGSGGEYKGNLALTTRKSGSVILDQHIECHRESSLNTRLVLGISRHDRMDYALQKAVELGVTEIQPVVTQRCARWPKKDQLEKKQSHWQRVVIAACEQSGRTQIPSLFHPIPLMEYVSHQHNRLEIVLDPEKGCRLNSLTLSTPRCVSVLIGPEGGLTPTEIAVAVKAGFIQVRMGPRILRTETAAVAALVALQILWGDFV